MTTVKDLITLLEVYPEDMEVYLEDEQKAVHLKKIGIESRDIHFPWNEPSMNSTVLALKLLEG